MNFRRFLIFCQLEILLSTSQLSSITSFLKNFRVTYSGANYQFLPFTTLQSRTVNIYGSQLSISYISVYLTGAVFQWITNRRLIPFKVSFLILYSPPQKTSENFWFFEVFRGYQKGTFGWDSKSPTVSRMKSPATIGSRLKKTIMDTIFAQRNCAIFWYFIIFLVMVIFETFWTSHFNERVVLFPHMVSKENILKHNLGLAVLDYVVLKMLFLGF